MVLRSLGGFGAVLIVVLALAAHQLGWVDGSVLARAGAVLALLVALFGVVQKPWDLVFRARDVRARQEASRRRGLEVDEVELRFARQSASRALGMAIALHGLGALLAWAARTLIGSELGLLLAAAFLISMAVRPVHAFYVHTLARLTRASLDAEVPRPDALSLAASIRALEAHVTELDEMQHSAREALGTRVGRLETQLREDAQAWRTGMAHTDEKIERVLREFERTVEKTQESAEVLTGIRAFVRLIRES